MWNELSRLNKKEEDVTIEQVRESYQRRTSRRTNDMEKIRLKCWLYHSESRHKNGNPPFRYENYTCAEDKFLYLNHIQFDLIDCEEFGGKEKATEIVEKWFA